MKKYIFFFIKTSLMSFSLLNIAAQDGKNLSRTYTIMFFNLDSDKKSADILPPLATLLANESPDIAIFAGIKNKKELAELLARSASYEFSFFQDDSSGQSLALISKIPPIESSIVKKKYKIKIKNADGKETETELDVSRGFLTAKFAIGNYVLHLIGAHLKSSEPHPEFNQFDMRRYEARQLRYLFDEIIKKDPKVNVIIVGNMNDSCGMSPIKEIYARKYGIEKRLFDVRPLDDLFTSWTFWNSASDEYERTSYAFANFAILPELRRDKTKVIRRDDWLKISQHRPIVVEFLPQNIEEYDKDKTIAEYPNSIYSGTADATTDDKALGEKTKRRSPKKNNSTK